MRALVIVACLGEPLICFSAPSMVDNPMAQVSEGGAEFNVAVHLSRLGLPVRFIGAVGDDVLGRRIRARLRREGVGVEALQLRGGERTGAYVKELGALRRSVVYLRSGSAASRLRPGADDFRDVDHLHLSGTTAALSPECADLLVRLLHRPRRYAVSFDVNHREGLWPAEQAATCLARLAACADLVLVGQDEAELLWGTESASAVRRFLPEPAELVVKDDRRAATAWYGPNRVAVEPQPVEVVDAVGAGDAFAAGYLYGRRKGHPPSAALRAGHRLARAALSATDDLGLPVPAAELDRLLEGAR